MCAMSLLRLGDGDGLVIEGDRPARRSHRLDLVTLNSESDYTGIQDGKACRRSDEIIK